MRIIVCDDDPNMLFLIKKWTKELLEGQAYQFAAYENGMDLLYEMEHNMGKEPSIVFMDIKLKSDNGISIAKLLNQDFGNVAVVFISGYTEYFQDSFEADPIYFLIKPIQKANFEKALEKAIKKVEEAKEKKKYFLVMQGKEIKRIFHDDLYYAESKARKISLSCKGEAVEYYDKMDRLEDELGEEFVRCHKSFLVNIRYVRCVDNKNITLLDGKQIPVSKQKYGETKEKIFQYLGGQL